MLSMFGGIIASALIGVTAPSVPASKSALAIDPYSIASGENPIYSALSPHDHEGSGKIEEMVAAFMLKSNVTACFAPGTSPDYVAKILRKLPSLSRSSGLSPAYVQAARWSSTVLNGSTGAKGTPIKLTYSFVQDGTQAPNLNNVNGGSVLFATLNSQFGSTATWKAIFKRIFDRWSAVAGIQYTEVIESGTNAPLPNSPGALNVRGDVRISMRPLDGYYGVLAFNYYPASNGGDMVMDSGEDWTQWPDLLFIRNVLAHEHGHGLGLAHVFPYTGQAGGGGNKLMEPYLASGFDGPQDDDIRGAVGNYGDPYEPNNTGVTATDLGNPTTLTTLSQLATSTSTDQDWFAVTPTAISYLNVTVNPIGSTYNIGPSDGNYSSVSTDQINDLQFSINSLSGSTATQIVNFNSTGKGAAESVTSFGPIGAGVKRLIKVYNVANGVNEDVQRYTLTVQLVPAATVSGKVTLPGVANASTVSLSFEFRPTAGGASFSRSAALDASGNYSFNDIPAGTYNVAIKGDRWLKKVVPNVSASAGGSVNVSTALIAGDVINSNAIDLIDLTALLNVYGTALGSIQYSSQPTADLNLDGSIDLTDLFLLLNNFGVAGNV